MESLGSSELLRFGVAEWNRWRQEERTAYPDLMGASLPHSQLDGVNLENSNLLEVNLQGASLASADLRNSNLKDARLRGANLHGANLTEVNLYGADLRNTDLSSANLCQTNMRQVRLDEACLDFTVFGNTGFDETILSAGEALKGIVHRYPSNVDVRTMEQTALFIKTRPELRTTIEWFYRGVGVPSDLIAYYFSRTTEERVFLTCFLSYSHNDGEFADILGRLLKRRGIHFWRDKKEVFPGSDLRASSTTGIIRYDRVLLCCSRHSLTSKWVELEIALALQKEALLGQNILLPLDLDGYLRTSWPSHLAASLSQRLIGDFVGWEENRPKLKRELQKVIQALRLNP